MLNYIKFYIKKKIYIWKLLLNKPVTRKKNNKKKKVLFFTKTNEYSNNCIVFNLLYVLKNPGEIYIYIFIKFAILFNYLKMDFAYNCFHCCMYL